MRCEPRISRKEEDVLVEDVMRAMASPAPTDVLHLFLEAMGAGEEHHVVHSAARAERSTGLSRKSRVDPKTAARVAGARGGRR